MDRAIELAVRAHQGQSREGGLPYIVHPMAVLQCVAQWGIDDLDVWRAAIAHDVLEDSDIADAVVAATIGDVAFEIVKELTFIPRPEAECGRDEAQQKAAYIGSFGDKSVESYVIKVADRVCNTLDRCHYDPPRAAAYWAKAQPLWDLIDVRRSEIESRFGKKVFASLAVDAQRTSELARA